MRIGYVGPFGDSNFGDYAMLVNDVYDIKEKEFTVFTYCKDFFQTIQKTYFKEYQVSICEVQAFPQEKPKDSKQYTISYNQYPSTPIEILREIKNKDAVKLFVQELDKLVVVGGGYFNHIWNAKHRREKLVSILAPILLAVQCHKKIVFMGNTYGPFEESSEMFANIFNYLQDVTLGTRDALYSKANLRKLGCDHPVSLIPDDLYFLNKKLLERKSYAFDIKGDYIILELYCSIDELEKMQKDVQKFVKAMDKKYHLKVVFLPFDKKYGGEYQAQELLKYTSDLYVYDFGKENFQKIEDVITLIQKATFILCQRYHLFILALANNIPVMQILKDVCNDKRYYYCKSNGILREVFQNQEYDETLFFCLTVQESFDKIINELPIICSSQKALFSSPKKKNCEEVYLQKRIEFIQKYILESE